MKEILQVYIYIYIIKTPSHLACLTRLRWHNLINLVTNPANLQCAVQPSESREKVLKNKADLGEKTRRAEKRLLATVCSHKFNQKL